jgi:hypothetical protein
MATSSLLKSALHNSVAEGLYNEIQTRTARYYYFLGKTVSWTVDTSPPYPTDSFAYELDTRNEIITMKEIKSTDVAFVVPRRDWTTNTVYDMFDDRYSDEVQGINLVSGGFGYSDPPTITISGGGGTGAAAAPILLDGVVVGITLSSKGSGYTSVPTVTISGGGGEGATATAVIKKGFYGATSVEDSQSYVLTDEYHVYKCLDNNNNALSTSKPIGTVVDPVIMPDGYMWKYLYSIPIALRNKFLTDAYMPVINSLRGQFYSGGEILNVIIESGGQNYTFASITVSGDGYRESDPLLLTSITLNSGGTGYTSGATVLIDPPFAGANTWAAGNGILLGQMIEQNNNLYECTKSGTLAAPAPTHRSGHVANGTATLLYKGTRATGTPVISGGIITSIALNGSIYEINITNGGSGYTSAPSVTVSGGGGSGFVGAVTMRGTAVAKVTISDAGAAYTSVPTVTFGTAWTSGATYTVNQQIRHGVNLYTVTTAGTAGTVAPVHSSGAVAATGGTAVFTFAGLAATGTVALKYGAGYSSLPNVSISPVSGGAGASGYFVGVKSEAKLIPIIDAGQIVGVQIDDGGVGYTYANLTVTGDGNNGGTTPDTALLTADLSPGDIDTLQANTELLTPDGRIMAYPIISGGYGYGSAPTVTIEGDGTGAAAEASVINGAVSKITVTNYGLGYRWANVTISGTGKGATARAVRAPFGGHGKDPINGMFARTLMFYTNISKDANQGFTVNNDFRQIGIIKNPRRFGDYGNLKSSLASACYVLTGTVNTTQFLPDMLIYLGSLTGRKFRIVSVTSTGMLVQSLENAVPTIGATFLNDSSNTFGVAGVTEPTADKYSGDLLFIDNKQAFTPTADQTVTIRTVIRF